MRNGTNVQSFFLSCWINIGKLDCITIQKRLEMLSESGFHEVVAGGSKKQIKVAAKICKELNLKLQHWHIMMTNNEKEILKDHADWFAVSRSGKNSSEFPPYVGYYHWMCPNHPAVLPYLRKVVSDYCEIEGLSGFHLDYIRFSDVILPVACQKQYDLVQTQEEPEYDFCYCPNCQSKFRKDYGYDIMQVSNPEEDANWRQFRFDSVSAIVNDLTELVHAHGKEITAAVFPTPEIARKLVRQDWAIWHLDAYYPMMYHEFYEQDNSWLSDAVSQCRNEVSKPIHAGIYLPSYDNESFLETLKILMKTDINGICLFDFNSLNDEKLQIAADFIKGE